MKLPEHLTTRQQKTIQGWKEIGVENGSTEFDTLWNATFSNGNGHKPNPHEIAEQRATAVREAEAVLFTLHSATSIEVHKCKGCGREFATNYRYNRHCSDECLAESLQNRMGIKWDPNKSAEERWKGEPPTIISPDTLQVLKAWARDLLGYANVTPPKDDQTIHAVNAYVRVEYGESVPMNKEQKQDFAEEMTAVLQSLDDTSDR